MVTNCKAVPGKTDVVYPGKATQFQFSVYSPEMKCRLYWDQRTLTFFRYDEAEDCYRAVDWTMAMMPPAMLMVKD